MKNNDQPKDKWLSLLILFFLLGILLITLPSRCNSNEIPQLFIQVKAIHSIALMDDNPTNSIPIIKQAKVYLPKVYGEDYYFTVTKNGNYLAKIESGEEATILFGDYKFEIYDQTSNKIVSTVVVKTTSIPISDDIQIIAKILGIILLIVISIWILMSKFILPSSKKRDSIERHTW